MKKDDEETADGEGDEDVPVELSTLIVTEVDGGDLPTGHKTVGDWIVYDEAWDETAELFVSNEVKEGEVEKSEIHGVRIRINKWDWVKLNWKIVE